MWYAARCKVALAYGAFVGRVIEMALGRTAGHNKSSLVFVVVVGGDGDGVV